MKEYSQAEIDIYFNPITGKMDIEKGNEKLKIIKKNNKAARFNSISGFLTSRYLNQKAEVESARENGPDVIYIEHKREDPNRFLLF